MPATLESLIRKTMQRSSLRFNLDGGSLNCRLSCFVFSISVFCADELRNSHIGGGFAADVQADFSRASEQLGQLHSGRLSVGKINVFPRDVIKQHFELTSFPQV